jgi:uncharacterized protein (DUF983 family)
MARGQPAELDPSRARRLLGRALRRRCPNCGGGPLFSSWLRMVDVCPSCGLRTQRGESDYFLGAYLFNLIIAELLFAALLTAVVIAAWPSPPWRLLEYASAVLVILAPIATYPFSKSLWLAWDVYFHPVTPQELRGERRA